MLVAAEFGTGQVLWSIFWFFLFFVWIMLVFQVFGDIIRADDMSGWSKAIWAASHHLPALSGDLHVFDRERGFDGGPPGAGGPAARGGDAGLHPFCRRIIESG